MTKRFGFTLAEVLITLGIIGVVAAMTMPTLMNSTQGAQYKAAYKKALSAISQGITLNVALDGNDFYAATAGTTAGAVNEANTVANILNSRMNVVKNTVGSSDGMGYTLPAEGAVSADTNTALFFNDGVVFVFPKDVAACTHGIAGQTDKICKGFIDVNGPKGPNKVVACTGGAGDTCEVSTATDIYPVKFYDQTILPNSPAARAVLYGK